MQWIKLVCQSAHIDPDPDVFLRAAFNLDSNEDHLLNQALTADHHAMVYQSEALLVYDFDNVAWATLYLLPQVILVYGFQRFRKLFEVKCL